MGTSNREFLPEDIFSGGPNHGEHLQEYVVYVTGVQIVKTQDGNQAHDIAKRLARAGTSAKVIETEITTLYYDA